MLERGASRWSSSKTCRGPLCRIAFGCEVGEFEHSALILGWHGSPQNGSIGVCFIAPFQKACVRYFYSWVARDFDNVKDAEQAGNTPV